ncbi:protein SMG7L [Punica granatum]|uniref:Protein SMG7L n=1 Tax=Punica granatum TaxID=22663 RepID=A0A6P8DCP0_PUNGR|nr:protein SMG7L [Punica granatum]
MESNLSTPGEKEKQSFLVEVSNIEKQLWALINSKGLLQPEVQNLYRRVCCSYEMIILKTSDIVNLQEVEYSLWKLHYKHIDEFRRLIKKGSARSSGHVEGLKRFLLDATELYRSLLLKLRSQSIPRDCIEQKQNSQFLCHRFLICLGDLARYRELFEKPEVEARNWSIAAGHYLEASKTWPDSGNPHNQLALLATYVGDEFLALYHCVRSLAIKEPFPDAWNNLVLLLEKSMSSPLCSASCEVSFDFLRPSERSKSEHDISKHEISAEERTSSGKNKLWPLIVRVASFFYIKSSSDEFLKTFGSAIKELEILMELDDTKLEDALKSYQFADSRDVGPTRAVQVVCTFIFIIQNLSENPFLRNLEEKNGTNHQELLRQYVISSTFIFMGRLTERCLKAHLVDLCPLLPSVLVFMEWLVIVLDDLELNGSNEEERAVSYFFGNIVLLLNSLKAGKAELGPQDHAALWEDYELRGFAPLAKSHILLDFSTSSAQNNSYQCGNSFRAQRILFAARRIAERSKMWVFYDKSIGKFSVSSKGEGKPVSLDEEEVILFKPLARHNSAPLYDCMNSKEHSVDGEDTDEAIVHSDECLRRTQTARVFKPFKQPESAISAGPPSLSAWVLNGGSSGTSVENQLSPIEELASTSLANLSITTSTQENPIPKSVHEAVITHSLAPPPYSAPIPSAPLLPEDATWFTGTQPTSHNGAQDRISGASYGNPGDFVNLAPHSPAGFLNLAYPVTRGLSSSEWLRKFREINNLHPGNGYMWAPTNPLGNFHALAGPEWGNQVPLGSNQLVYLSPKPQSHPELYQGPIPYGCGGVVSDPVRDDQLSLLQYLNEKEWRLQQDPSMRGPTFLGN